MATVIEVPPSVPTTDAPYDGPTVDEFSQLVEMGLFPRDRRVYLRDGSLSEKVAKSKPHGWAGAAVVRAVGRPAPGRPRPKACGMALASGVGGRGGPRSVAVRLD